MQYVERMLGVSIRKVYKQNGSYVITLPREWIDSEFYKLRISEKREIILTPVR